MAEEGSPRGGVHGAGRTGARAGARTWPLGARRPSRTAWGSAWADRDFAVPARLRAWAAAEIGAGRLLPWFAVAFGAGIVLYFAAEREPAWWAALSAAVVAAAAAVLAHRRPTALVAALGLLAIAAGFAAATVKTALIDHPVLRYPGIMAQTPQDLNPRPS